MKHLNRYVLIACLLMVTLFILCSCECPHAWKDATCTSAKVCSLCNITDGEALGHEYITAADLGFTYF